MYYSYNSKTISIYDKLELLADKNFVLGDNLSKSESITKNLI